MSASDLPEPTYFIWEDSFEGRCWGSPDEFHPKDAEPFYTADQLRAYGDKRAREAVEALADEVRDYLDAQDALDNWELQSINREPHDRVMRRRNLARNSLRAILDAFPSLASAPTPGEKT